VAKVIEAEPPQAAWATMEWRALLNIFIVGLLVGVVTYALYLLLLQLVFEPIMCRGTGAIVRCESKESFAGAVAIVVGSMVGLVFLVRERVYRPLLVVIACMLALWGIFTLVATLPWLLATVVVAVAFALGYATFAWVVQPASFVFALVFATFVVVLTRLVLTS